MTKDINNSEWKERIGIDKVSTRFNQGSVKLQARFKEQQKKQKSIWTKIDYEGTTTAGFTIRF